MRVCNKKVVWKMSIYITLPDEDMIGLDFPIDILLRRAYDFFRLRR